MANKVKFGIRNAYYAVATEAADGSFTYDTPVRIPGAISISLTPRNFSRVLAADDIEYWRGTGNSGYDGDLNMALIPDNFRADVLGEMVDDSGVHYETSALVSTRFALLFEFQGDANGVRHCLYNCTATRPTVASQTITPADGPDPSQGTETVTISASARPADGLIKSRFSPAAGSSTGSTIYNNWFASVYEPEIAT